MKKLLLVVLLVPGAAACATTRAQTQPIEQQPMAVPPVPPRIIEPAPVTEQTPFEPVAEMPAAPATPPRPRPPRDPARTGGSSDPKGESKPPETPPETGTAQPPATQPVPPLRPQGSADAPEMARQVRETLDRASKMLDSIDPRTLSNERKVNYDAARDFIRQAEEAITQEKLVFAKSLAERAEQVARQLGGRE